MQRTILAALILSSLAYAGDPMPVAQQNALVQKYCAVCHTDAVRNGGLSLQHFDAASAAPSLAAMLVSKLTGGASVETAIAASTDAQAADLVSRKMKAGAMGAAGLPIPDKPTIDALIDALASRAARATEWSTERTPSKTPIVTASILREVPSPGNTGEAAMYRLIVTCNLATQQGDMQLAWSPMPTRGTLSTVADGNAPLSYKVEGLEHMGNGSNATTGPAAVSLNDPKQPLPTKSLRITNLFPNQSVEFPFSDLPTTARQSLSQCFKPSDTGN